MIKSKEKRKKKLQKALAVMLAMALLMTTMSLGVLASDYEPAGDVDTSEQGSADYSSGDDSQDSGDYGADASTPEGDVDGDSSYDAAPDYGAYYDEPKYDGDKNNSEYYEKSYEEYEYEKYVPIIEMEYIGIVPMLDNPNLAGLNDNLALQVQHPITRAYNPPFMAQATNMVDLPYIIPDFESIMTLPFFADVNWEEWRIGFATLGLAINPGPGSPDTYVITQVGLDPLHIYYKLPDHIMNSDVPLFWGANPIFRIYFEPIPVVDKAANPEIILSGDTMTYIITVENTSNRPVNTFTGPNHTLECVVVNPNAARPGVCCQIMNALRLVDDVNHLLDEGLIENVSNIRVLHEYTVGTVNYGTPTFENGIIDMPITHMSAGGRIRLAFDATVLDDAIGKYITNNARLTTHDGRELTRYSPVIGRLPGGGGGRETSSVTFQVFEPILSIEKLVNERDVYNKESDTLANYFTYTIIVTNHGDAPLPAGFSVVDDLSGLIGTYIDSFPETSVTVTDGRLHTLTGGILTVMLDGLASGDYVKIQIEVYLYEDRDLNVQSFVNTANVKNPSGSQAYRTIRDTSGTIIGREPLSDFATVTLLPTPDPDLRIVKLVNGRDVYNKTANTITNDLRYTIVVTNNSHEFALPNGFSMVDDLSSLIGTYIASFGEANVRVIGAGTFESIENGILTVMLGQIPPRESVRIEIDVPLHEGLTLNNQSFVNTANVKDPSGEQAYNITTDENGDEIRVPLRDTATVTLPRPIDPIDPGDTGNTGNTNNPTNPIDPVDPEDPENPEDQVDPVDPEDTVDPQEPQNPVDPQDSTTPPATEGENVVMQEEGRWLLIDDDGVPLGYWVWDEVSEMWIFEENAVPLGLLLIPQTGLSGNLMNWMLLVGSLMVIAVLMTRKRNKDKLQEQGLGTF